MSERKVLNKYYPPDFDPSKIPRMKLPRNRQYTVRLMAPFNMRCITCGEYIYKGKKFNARKEDVEGEDYLGIRIYRFYIKCTRCLQEISFKTDPRNTDYEIEAGATRNFMALKLAEEQAQREEDERKEDEATNPMKLLENRTKQSKQELELLESLEELRDLNRRQRSVDYDTMLSQFDTKEAQKKLQEKQEEEDEKFIRSVFGSSKRKVISEEIIETVDDDQASDDDTYEAPKKVSKTSDGTASFITHTQTSTSAALKPRPAEVLSNKSMGSLTKKTGLTGLVRVKSSNDTATKAPENNSRSEPVQANSSSKQSSTQPAVNGLSLLGSYSGSDSE
ncbi:splicing factor YJU2 [Periplaneta americana]|uniref:splicing factor YJU2 n=1 Tax=Periplaneta americana TaxID=6978 RepID=UPI0037E7A7DE